MQAKIKKNYVKDKNKRELIQNIIQMPKPKIKKNYTKSFGFRPKKYDMIINSLMEQINQGEKKNKKNDLNIFTLQSQEEKIQIFKCSYC